nr:site-specific integrase [uncultured Acetatifactor sp.]
MDDGKKRNAKGEGTFIQNKNGTITHKLNVGRRWDGRPKVLTVTCETKAACIREMRKKVAEWNASQDTAGLMAKGTVGDLCWKHLEFQVEHDELKPKSRNRRETTIKCHIEAYALGRMQVQAIGISDIEKHIAILLNEDRLSDSSVKKVVDVLNAAYTWAVSRGKVSTNPVAPIKETLMKRIMRKHAKTVEEPDVIVLSEEEEKRFVKEALAINDKTGGYKYPAGLYGLLLLYTGIRVGEALALRFGDYDAKYGILKIYKSASMVRNHDEKTDKRQIMIEGTTKNQQARNIVLNSDAKNILELIRRNAKDCSPDALVITTKTGRQNTATNLQHRMKVIFHNAGLDSYSGGLHIFRRTFATNMYDAGARVEEIAAYIGDLESTTRRYYIAIRKKVSVQGIEKQIVPLPDSMKKKK